MKLSLPAYLELYSASFTSAAIWSTRSSISSRFRRMPFLRKSSAILLRVSSPFSGANNKPAAAPKAAAGAAGAVAVKAPMPGNILDVKVAAGASVKAGDVLVILEAMKMENEIVAPQDGTVATINVAVGDSVEPGATLATLN